MKLIAAVIFAFALIATGKARGVPTPDMAMSWNQKKDSRTWAPQFQGGNQSRILMEFVPQGDDIKKWREMVIHQIDFTSVTLREYVDGWKAMLLRADPKIKITEEQLEDGSLLMTFLSVTPDHSSDELCVRRFIKGSDGVYQLAYSVRPSLKKEDIWIIWSEILSGAKLMPNPEKR
jgi:hypothetical protein